MNESEETEKIKTFPLYPYLLQEYQALPNWKPISVGRPGDVRYTTHLPHPTISDFSITIYVAGTYIHKKRLDEALLIIAFIICFVNKLKQEDHGGSFITDLSKQICILTIEISSKM